MSMPDYYATLTAIGTDPSCAPMLADKFEEAGMDWHAVYFRTGYEAPRNTDELLTILAHYVSPDVVCRNESFTTSLCYALVGGTHLIEPISRFNLCVVVNSVIGGTVEEILADYNLIPRMVKSRWDSHRKEITFE